MVRDVAGFIAMVEVYDARGNMYDPDRPSVDSTEVGLLNPTAVKTSADSPYTAELWEIVKVDPS